MLIFAPILGGAPEDTVRLVVCTPVASDISRVGDYVLFRVAETVHSRGITIPEGCPGVGKVQRQSKKVAFSLGRVVMKGDSPFASPHAVISISADYVTLPDGRTVSVRIDPAPRTDDLYEKNDLRNEYWPQHTMEPESPPAPLTAADAAEWDRVFRVATNKNLALGKIASSENSNDLLSNSLASMRDVLALRQTVKFIDENGVERLQAAATAITRHSAKGLAADKGTTSAVALTFAAAVEVTNLYSRSHRGIRAWERRQQIGILPGVVVKAQVVGVD